LNVHVVPGMGQPVAEVSLIHPLVQAMIKAALAGGT
jgi:hypothetical protein